MAVTAKKVNVHEKGIIRMNIHCIVILFVENLGVSYYEFMIYRPHSDFISISRFLLIMTSTNRSKSK